MKIATIIATIIATAIIPVHAENVVSVSDASGAIATQIGWLVIQNANLQAQIDDLKKQVADCKSKESTDIRPHR